ncbi:MAG: Gfo/Idh/MocA family oxidoreductase [Armatimonadetes bacterium]|nr:Gfo/Idh/MocA family oxidoreductase [Armatimonadota bacterium]
MKPLNVAIIGQGRSGRDIHGAYLKKDPEYFRIAAVVDLIEDRRHRAAAEYECDVYADYRELLKRSDLDLVVNSTPSHLHVPVTREFLAAGFNVLCEKPLAKRASEVDDLIAVSKRAGKVLAIFQQSRYSPVFLKLREVLASGVLGRIVQISMAWNGFGRRWDWQTLQKFNGGSLLNTGPHPLDQALQLFGEGMPEVFCRMDRANTWGNAEDHVKIVLSGTGHPIIDMEVSSCLAYPCFSYNVYATRGGLKGSQTAMEWKHFIPEEAPEQRLIEEPLRTEEGLPCYCREELVWHTGSWDAKEARDASGGSFTNAVASIYHMLYRTLATGAPLEVTPEQVRRQIAVIEECHRQNPGIY